VLIAGRSSKSRKGQSWGEVAPILKIADPDWYRDCLIGGLSTGEGVIEAVKDPDITVQAGTLMMTTTDKRALFKESEFGRVLTVVRRQDNTLSMVLRQAWDGETLRVKTKKNPLTATDVHVSIIAHVTAEELLRLTTATDAYNGFLNRFLMVGASRKNRLPHGGSVDLSVIQRFGDLLRDVVEFWKGEGDVQITRTPAADALWDAEYDRLSAAKDGLEGAIGARGEPQVLRLSLIYALIDKSLVIDVQHVEAALAFWDHCEATINALWGSGRTKEPAWATKLLPLLQSKAYSMTEIHAALGRNIEVNAIRQKLDDWYAAGMIDRTTAPSGPKGGRPTELWGPKPAPDVPAQGLDDPGGLELDEPGAPAPFIGIIEDEDDGAPTVGLDEFTPEELETLSQLREEYEAQDEALDAEFTE
jgi:Protein of unknown function (DUF3987)